MRALRQRIAGFSKAGEAPSGSQPRKRRTSRSAKPSVSGHRAFVPLCAIWGLLLGALCVLVLPSANISRITSIAGLTGMGAFAPYVLIAIAGVVGGGVALLAALAFRRGRSRKENSGSVATMAARRVLPIDPVAELGSESLDAPIKEQPFSAASSDSGTESKDTVDHAEAQPSEPSELPYADSDNALPKGELTSHNHNDQPLDASPSKPDDAEQTLQFTKRDFEAALAETSERQAEISEERQSVPREMALSEFAEFPGRNAVWIEEQQEIHSPAPSVEPIETPTKPKVPSAIEKLRSTPPRELSLMQMVERFAAALHEYQSADHARAGAMSTPNRDHALAEALKALTALTESPDGYGTAYADQSSAGASGFATETDALRDTTRELRDALAKLQTLRGAA